MAHLDDPNQSVTRFKFPPNMWRSKILQAQTPEEIYEVSKMMSDVPTAIESIKIYDEGLRNSNTKKLANEGKETLKKAEKFLNTKRTTEKRAIFFDGDQLKDLNPGLQTLSPSNDHELFDFHTVEFNNEDRRKWYYLWLA